MSRPGLEALSKLLWPAARHPLLSAARALALGKDGLRLVRSQIRRRVEARLRAALFVLVLSLAGAGLALAGGVFLLMALWGVLAMRLGANAASLALGLALLCASLLPLALAARRATPRRHPRD